MKKFNYGRSLLSESEILEQFLIYAYWYFDEYYSETLKNIDSNNLELEKSIGKIWEESLFQIEYFMENRQYTAHCSEMTYSQFSDFSSDIRNHKLDFFKIK